MLQTGSGQLSSNLKALPDGRTSLRELLLRSFSQFYQVMAGGFYPPICKSARRYGGRAGGWLIHWVSVFVIFSAHANFHGDPTDSYWKKFAWSWKNMVFSNSMYKPNEVQCVSRGDGTSSIPISWPSWTENKAQLPIFLGHNVQLAIILFSRTWPIYLCYMASCIVNKCSQILS